MFGKLFVAFGLLLLFNWVQAQNVDIQPTIMPDFFKADEEITVTYDVTGTSLASLNDAWLWLWLPDVSNTNVGSNVNPASSNVTATNPAKFIKQVDGSKTFFIISLILTDFVQKSTSEITKVGILIKGNDWPNGQSTDFVFEISSGSAMKVNNPFGKYSFQEPGDTIIVDIVLSKSAIISLRIDQIEILASASDNMVYYKHAVIGDGLVHDIDFESTFDDITLYFSHSYTTPPVTSQTMIPAGMVDGANYDSDISATLVLTAPLKESVFVIGDFNDWSLSQDYLMRQDKDKFWLEISGLEPGKEYIYQYLIDGSEIIADPYTEKVSSAYDDQEIIEQNRYPTLIPYPHDKTQFEASYLQTAQPPYEWVVTDFQKPRKENLVVYELLVRDFTEDRSYRAVINKLDYLDSLGINALELMPVTEFEGNLSWGYNPSFMLAQDKFYGTEAELKELIDKAHEHGIAVIFDIVLNHHFGRSPLVNMYSSGDFGPPTSENVWFNTNPKHDFNVGYDFNHESQYTKDYVDRVVKFWVDKYKVDGYRFDLSKGFTQKNTLGNVGAWGQYDQSRVSTWKRIADVIWDHNPETYVILEHFADNAEEKELANYGMMIWGNMNGDYRKVAKAQSINLNWGYYANRGWDKPNLVTYMESHDEERVMWDLSEQNKSMQESLNRIKMNAAFFFLVPGPKMLWQFEEMGYDEELNNDRVGIKPTHWEYLSDPERLKLYATFQSLIKLKTQTEYLNDEDFSMDASKTIKWINYDNDNLKICLFGNFSAFTKTDDPHILSTGIWYDYFSKEEVTVDNASEVTLAAGEFHILTSKPIDNFIKIDPIDILTNVKEWESTEFSIFPNPINEKVFVKTTNRNIKSVKLMEMSGKVLITKSQFNSSKHVAIDTSTLEPGVYFLKIETDINIFSKKIIKQ